jgi:hypothetical protein
MKPRRVLEWSRMAPFDGVVLWRHWNGITFRPVICLPLRWCSRSCKTRTAALNRIVTAKNSQTYPALARIPSELFGICVVGTSERIYGAGDVDYEFSIMSVSKPFLFALICETIGPEEARAKLGANATGLPFNSLAKIAANPLLPKEIQAQVDLGNITCVSNDQLRSVMEKTTATPQQVQEALRVNIEARLRALKIGPLFMAGLPLLAVIRPTSPRTTFRERS